MITAKISNEQKDMLDLLNKMQNNQVNHTSSLSSTLISMILYHSS